jgi:hypothetical protein
MQDNEQKSEVPEPLPRWLALSAAMVAEFGDPEEEAAYIRSRVQAFERLDREFRDAPWWKKLQWLCRRTWWRIFPESRHEDRR